ncbi:MAG: hypothetical protein IT384_09480 [Deltaproteobacteria bacterium]|nr:hypothetical protein [Deltaproteobacteria bacterium]
MLASGCVPFGPAGDLNEVDPARDGSAPVDAAPSDAAPSDATDVADGGPADAAPAGDAEPARDSEVGPSPDVNTDGGGERLDTGVTVGADVSTEGCSTTSTVEATVIIVNAYHDRAVSLYWLDQFCGEQLFSDIPADNTVVQPTYLNAVWRVRNTSTLDLLAETPRLTQARTTVIVPSTGTVCSDFSEATAELTIINNDDVRTVSLFWVNYACEEVHTGDVPPHMMTTQQTFLGHQWRLRDQATQDLIRELWATSAAETVTIP